MLSPTFKVREFKVEESAPYPVQLKWKQSMADEDAYVFLCWTVCGVFFHTFSALPLFVFFILYLFRQMEVFPIGATYPQAKMLTFYRKEPFSLEAFYTGPNHFIPRIGTLQEWQELCRSGTLHCFSTL